MAGSCGWQKSELSELDEALRERIEGLKLLAHYLDEPIVIFNPQMELVYANPSADRMARDCPLVRNGLKENHPFAYLQQPPCDPCPGKFLFEGIPLSSQSSVFLQPSSAHVNPVYSYEAKLTKVDIGCSSDGHAQVMRSLRLRGFSK